MAGHQNINWPPRRVHFFPWQEHFKQTMPGTLAREIEVMAVEYGQYQSPNFWTRSSEDEDTVVNTGLARAAVIDYPEIVDITLELMSFAVLDLYIEPFGGRSNDDNLVEQAWNRLFQLAKENSSYRLRVQPWVRFFKKYVDLLRRLRRFFKEEEDQSGSSRWDHGARRILYLLGRSTEGCLRLAQLNELEFNPFWPHI